jgi:radical SAM protein (TIGR01212 family)
MPVPLIRTFSYHYRERYGESIGKIPIDLGLVCPNRQNGGCIFCRPASFTPGYLNRKDGVEKQITRGKSHILKGRFKKYFAYFQQETCTALPVGDFIPLIGLVLKDPQCIGLIISTRPDHVSNALLAALATEIAVSGKECLFELGLQTIHEAGLKFLNRNHSYADFTDSVERIQQAEVFEVGAHLIFGIPGESEEDMLNSLRTVCRLNINALKLHHLQVIADTPLHHMYVRGEVEVFTLEAYISFLLRALPLIPTDVTLHRLWATSHPELLIAPKWNVLAATLSKNLQNQMALFGLQQGQL